MAERRLFRVAPGVVIAPPSVWASMEKLLSQIVRRELSAGRGANVRALLQLVDASSEAALGNAPDTVVSPPKPTPTASASVELLTPKEAAERRGCSEQYIRTLCRERRIQAHRYGQQWLIPADQIDRQTPRE